MKSTDVHLSIRIVAKYKIYMICQKMLTKYKISIKHYENLEFQPFPDTEGRPRSTYSPKKPINVSISEQSVVLLTGMFESIRYRLIIPK